MKLRNLLLSITLTAFFTSVNAQEQTDFKQSGHATVKVFTNFHSAFDGPKAHNAFEIQRAYFGYSFNLSEKFSAKVLLDVGDPGVGKLQMTAYLKNAYLQYKSGKFTTKFGLIGLAQFDLQEGLWGNRYLYKSFQDEHKFGSSADLGAFASYKFNSIISVDATIANGEGYKSLENDSVLKYSLGATINPLKGLTFRAYYDMMGNSNSQNSLSLFLGYSREKFNIGAEYALQTNNKMKTDHDMSGISVFSSYKIKKVRLFARYDQLTSTKIGAATNAWNANSDGEAIIGGIEFAPIKGVKIAPNYQVWMPANGGPAENIVYLSLEIKI